MDKLTRREFLRLTGATAATLIATQLAGCASPLTPASDKPIIPNPTLSREEEQTIKKNEYIIAFQQRLTTYRQFAKPQDNFLPYLIISDTPYAKYPHALLTAAGQEITVHPPGLKQTPDLLYHEFFHIDITKIQTISNLLLKKYKYLFTFDEKTVSNPQESQFFVGFELRVGFGGNTLFPTKLIEEATADYVMEAISKQQATPTQSAQKGPYGLADFVQIVNTDANITIQEMVGLHRQSDLMGYMKKILTKIDPKNDYTQDELLIAARCMAITLENFYNKTEGINTAQQAYDAFKAKYKVLKKYQYSNYSPSNRSLILFDYVNLQNNHPISTQLQQENLNV